VTSDPTVVVVGSLNVDHTFRVPRIPAAGETLTARSALTGFGGKGANQAVAAARAGARVRLIGCVGDDDPGEAYLAHLVAEGIDTGDMLTAAGEATGSAFITVDDEGENSIVVHPGANHALTPEMIADAAPAFADADVLLLQLECPLAAVRRAAELAREAGTTVILNPSPWDDALRGAGVPVDIYIVNETEATAIGGGKSQAIAASPSALGCHTIIVTRGAEPTVVVTGVGTIQATPPAVTPVDTVGAGDTFAGAFSVAFAEGQPLSEAVAFANRAAALATTQAGAQAAIPTREQIAAFQP
jgi:ribokinase